MDPAPHLRLDLLAVSGNVPLIRHALVAFAASHGADDELQGTLALAITEAVANVVVHAYRDRDEPANVTVEASAADGRLDVVVRDEGLGLSARYESSGLGMGLPIIADVCDHFAVRDRQPRGTEVSMRFALGGA